MDAVVMTVSLIKLWDVISDVKDLWDFFQGVSEFFKGDDLEMSGKKKKPNNYNNSNNNPGQKIKLWKELAVIDVVPDRYLSVADLKVIRSKAYSWLPERPTGDHIPNTYDEIFGCMLASKGFVLNDSKEALDMVERTGTAVHYLQIPDLDSGSENRGERGQAKLLGRNFLAAYDAVAKLRKSAYKDNKKELKDVDQWREWKS
jgi:hypothetical protein